MVERPEPWEGTYRGRLKKVRVRTWAGCVFDPGEEVRYPVVLALRLRPFGPLMPLKVAPAGMTDRQRMRAEVAAWRAAGVGPPYAWEASPWLREADVKPWGWSVGDRVELGGFAHPLFYAGTTFSYSVWGLCVETT